MKYVFEKKIGAGRFGSVYRGKNVISGDKVAIKFEATTVKIPTLLWESKILNHLAGTLGVVKLRYFGTESNKNIIVMDLFSHTLCEEIQRLKAANMRDKVFTQKSKQAPSTLDSDNESPNNESTKKEVTSKINSSSETEKKECEELDTSYSPREDVSVNGLDDIDKNIPTNTKEVTQYLISMLQLINRVHDAGILHRDIKPENFMISCDAEGGEKKLNIIDFGLSRFYMKGDKHVINTYNKSIVGTIRYISKHIHGGDVYARRDDIISIVYVAIYLLKGKLPWTGLYTKKGDTRTKEELVYDKKLKTTSAELCEGLPNLFQKLIDYSYTLEYEDKPDYSYMIRQCKNLLKVL
jgi:serine/threonine protein kinase